MIKITVDQKVYAALQKAFPKPANTAHRALAKYIQVLEVMLFKSLHFAATPLQCKFNLFTIRCNSWQIKAVRLDPRSCAYMPG